MSESPEQAVPSEALPTVLFRGTDLLLVDANGEVIGEQAAPETTATDKEIVDYLGPRLKRAAARLAGLEAEKAAMIEQINRHYDPQINQARGYLSWLKGNYADRLRSLAMQMLDGRKERSCRVGLMVLKFRRRPGKTEVADLATALVWAKAACPSAVRVEEKLLVSQIPADMDLPEGASGLRRIPAEDVFEVE